MGVNEVRDMSLTGRLYESKARLNHLLLWNPRHIHLVYPVACCSHRENCLLDGRSGGHTP